MTLSPPLAPSGSATAVPSVRVLFFGKLADTLGRARELEMPAAGCTLAELRRRLGELAVGGHAALGEPGVRAAVDLEMVLRDDAPVRPGAEVAFFPAFSGG